MEMYEYTIKMLPDDAIITSLNIPANSFINYRKVRKI